MTGSGRPAQAPGARVLIALGNLAKVYEDRGDHARALRLARDALAIHRKAQGPDTPETKLAEEALARIEAGRAGS